MNILCLSGDFLNVNETMQAFNELGHKTFSFEHPDYNLRNSKDFTEKYIAKAEEVKADLLFSYNYHPLIAECAKKLNIKYVSVVYDSPHVALFSYTVIYPTNYIFIFDSVLCDRLRREGITTVYYIPLFSDIFTPTNTKLMERYKSEVSFVGSLYNEKHNLFDEKFGELSQYTAGFLSGMMEAQQRVYGDNFIENSLIDNPEILNEIREKVNYQGFYDGVETDSYVYAHYIINRKITQIERNRLLTMVSEKYPLNLFTRNKDAVIGKAANFGPVNYYEQMPYVFNASKINLNISLRSIISGIPLRCIDIMAKGGFLLTNYQSDMLRHFEPGVEFDYFESPEDLMYKIGYYLDHDKERKEIAAAGQEKVKNEHTIIIRMREILEFISQ